MRFVESRALYVKRINRRKILGAALAQIYPPASTPPGNIRPSRTNKVESRSIFLKRINRRKILASWLLHNSPPPVNEALYRVPQHPELLYPKPVYPKKRKPAYTLIFLPAGQPVAVPNLIGLTQAAATFALTSIGLVTGTINSAYSSSVPIGIVFSQSPVAGSSVATGTAVGFVLSLGPFPVQVAVPNVLGLPQVSALADLNAAGFAAVSAYAVSSTVPVGSVISQTPVGGTLEYLPFTVTIVISTPASIATTWPQPYSGPNLPARGAWELPGGKQAIWVVGSGVFLMTVKQAATASLPATFTLKRVGALNTSTGPVCIRDNGAGGAVCIVDGPYGYYYIFGVAAVTTQYPIGSFYQITDPNFQGATRICFIDGWWIFNVPNTQEFYTPESTYALAFNGTNFALIDSATDNLVTMYENKEELWLVGEKHTEIWYDAGGQYFAFARLVSTVLQVGCAASASIARFESEGQDGLVWFAKSERGQNVVVKTEGFSAVVISTPAINHAFAQYTIVSDAIGYTYQEDGHEFYVLTFPSVTNDSGGTGITWVYDNLTDLWHQRLAFEPYSGTWYRHRSNCFLNFQNQRLVGDFQNGLIYRMDRTVYTDNGWPLVAWRRTPHIWDGGARERVFMAFLQIENRPGVGNQSGLGTNPTVFLQISRDGGQTWGQILGRALGAVGQYLNRVIWRRLSFSRDAVIDVKIYDPVNRDITGATLKKGEQP